MSHRAGRIIHIVICNQNLLSGIIQPVESVEFPLICFFINHAVGYLDQVFFSRFGSNKIDLFSGMIIYLHDVPAIKQFKINNVFQIVVDVVPDILSTNRIQRHVPVIKRFVKQQFLFCID